MCNVNKLKAGLQNDNFQGQSADNVESVSSGIAFHLFLDNQVDPS